MATMTTKSRNSASQRTHEWRQLQKELGNKQITSWLHSSTIEQLDAYSKQNACSRNDSIVSAIVSFLENQNPDNAADAKQKNTANAADAKSTIPNMQQIQTIIDSYIKQLDVKDHQINQLLESNKANNYTIASSFKKLGLLEQPKDQPYDEPEVETVDEYYTPKKSKSKKNKKRKKSKKKK